MLNHGGIGEIKGDVSNRGTLICREEKIDLVLDTNEGKLDVLWFAACGGSL